MEGLQEGTMAHVAINAEKLGAANKYVNLIRNKGKRRYAQAYIDWLHNGAEGIEPQWECSYMAAQSGTDAH
jgi:hypothetical protein